MKARAVCRYCARKTRWHGTVDGRLWIDDLPRGWWVAPYPPLFEHGNGTHGDRFTCRVCASGSLIGVLPLTVEGTEWCVGRLATPVA